MNAIAAVDVNWAIGNKNRLLTSIPADIFQREDNGTCCCNGKKNFGKLPEWAAS